MFTSNTETETNQMTTFNFNTEAEYLDYLKANKTAFVVDYGYCKIMNVWFVEAIVLGINPKVFN